MWRSTGALSLQSPVARTGRAIIVRGALLNLLNPKLTIFFFAFLPQFLEPGTSATAQMVLLGGVFMAVTLAVFVLYGVVASTLRNRVVGSPTVVQRLQRSFAAAFAALGVRLAVQDR